MMLAKRVAALLTTIVIAMLLTGMVALTAMPVKARAVEAGGETTGMITAAVAPAKPQAADEMITYELNDSYGDGWNGAAITIVDTADNSELASLTFGFGNHADGAVSLVRGHVYQFIWTSGSWDSECSYTFKSGDETILAGGGSGTQSGTVLLTYVAGLGPYASYDLWIANTQVSNANAADVLGDGTVSYDLETKTLTLDNCVCVRDGGDNAKTAPLYLDIAEGPVTIILKGDNVLECGPNDQAGIYARAGVTFTGDGSLTVTGGRSYSGTNDSYGIKSNVTLDASFTGTVVARGGATGGKSAGVYATSVNVNGGTLVAEGGVGVDNDSIGIHANSSLSVTGGILVAQGGFVAEGASSGVNLGDSGTINVSGGVFLVQGGNTSSSGHSRGVNCSGGGSATFSGGASVVRAGAIGTSSTRYSSPNRAVFNKCSRTNTGMSTVTVGYSLLGVFVSSNTKIATGFACVPSSWTKLGSDPAKVTIPATLESDSYFINSSKKASLSSGLSSLDTNGHTLFVVNLFEGDPTDRAAGLVFSSTGDVELTGTGSVVAVGGLTKADPSFGLYANGNLSVAGPSVIGVSGQSNNDSDGVCCTSGSLTVSSGKVIGVGSSPNSSSYESHGVNVNQGIAASGTGFVAGLGGFTSSSNTYGIKAQGVTTHGSASVLGVGGSASGSGANSYGINANSVEVAGGAATGVGGDRATGSYGVDSGGVLVRRGFRLTAVGGTQATDYSYGIAGLADGGTLKGNAAIAGTTGAIGSSDGTLLLDKTGLALGYTDFAGTAEEALIESGVELSTLSGYKHIKVSTPPGPMTSGECGTCYWEITPDKVLTVYPGTLEPAQDAHMPWYPTSGSAWQLSDIGQVVMVSRGANKVVAPSDSKYILSQLSYAKSMDLSGLDTSQAQDLSHLFASSAALEALDVSMLDTSKATTMKSMFQDCPQLGRLDLSAFDMTKVTDVSSMFAGCTSLGSAGLPAAGMGNVVDASNMFAGCTSLGSLDLSALDMVKVADASNMFSGCASLTGLSLPTAGMASVTDASGMFSGCASLESLDLSAAGFASVADASSMFAGCSSLESLDLSAAGMASVTDASGMFSDCSSLKSLDLSTVDMTKVSNASNMFSGCTSLESIKLGSASKLASNVALTEAPTAHPYTGKWIRQEGGEPLTATELMSTYDGSTMAGTYVWEQIVQHTPEELNQLIATATTTSPYKDVDSVQVSTDGSEVFLVDTWVTQEVKDALVTAIAAAREVAANEEATQEQRDDAYYALEAAMANYVPKRGVVEKPVVEVTTWSRLCELLQENGSNIKLTSDVKYGTGGGEHESDALVVPAGFIASIDLNGHIVDRGLTEAVEGGSVIDVFGELTIKDSRPTATHEHAFTFVDPLNAENIVTVKGGIITGGYAVSQHESISDWYFGGGGVLVENDAHLVMTGGSICRNHATAGQGYGDCGGGGVAVKPNAIFDMSGTAAVCGNRADDDGGGVFMANAVLNMDENASICFNTAGDHGGGVYALRCSVSMKGDSRINGNKAHAFGGGAFFYYSSSLAMEDNAEIASNHTDYHGGGVAMYSFIATEMSITMKDKSRIYANSCNDDGGGVFLGTDEVVLNMSDESSISGNFASSEGGGVYANGGTLNMYGGEISGNSSNGSGGGVCLGNLNGGSALHMSGGTITGNSTHGSGGGVYAHSNARAFTLEGDVKIDGNKIVDNNGEYVADSNVYGDCWDGAMAHPIVVTGPLAEGSTIGIDKWGTPPTDTPVVAINGFEENNPDSDYTDFFHIDNDSYIITVDDAGDVTIKLVEAYGLWLGDVQVTNRNADDILGDGTASFDREAETLTLAGASIGQGGVDGAGICGIAAKGLGTLHVVLAEGTSSTINVGAENPDDPTYGIYCDSDVVISGEGSLGVNVSGENAVGISVPNGSAKFHDGAAANVTILGGGMTGVEAKYFEARDASVKVIEGAGTGILAHDGVYIYGAAQIDSKGRGYGVKCPAFLMEDSAHLRAVGTGDNSYGLHFGYGAIVDQHGNSVEDVDLRGYVQLEAQGASGATNEALRGDLYSADGTVKAAVKVELDGEEQLVDASGLNPSTYRYLRMPASHAYPVMVATPNWEEGKPYLTQVDSSNASNVFGDGTVSYDPRHNVLTLNGYHYTVGNDEQAARNALQIDGPMTICLTGENSISSGEFATCQREAIFADTQKQGDLTFTGEGSLAIDWKAGGSLGAAVAGCNITIADNANVSIMATKTEASGESKLFSGVHANGNLAIRDSADLTATAACADASIDDVVAAAGVCVSETGKLVVADMALIDVSGSDGAILDRTLDGLVIDWSGYEQVEGVELPMIETCVDARSIGSHLSTWDNTGSLSATFDGDTGAVTRDFRWVRIGSLEYDLWVGGTQVNMANAPDVFGDGTVSYDSAENVLHLNGYTYSGIGDLIQHAVITSNIENLTIDVAGVNSLTGESAPNTSYGIFALNGLAFTGDGSLEVASSEVMGYPIRSAGIFVNSGEMVVGEDFTGKLTARSGSGDVDTRGIYVGNGTLTIAGGEVNAIAGDVPNSSDTSAASYGIYVFGDGDIAITGGKVYAEAGSVHFAGGDEYGKNAGIKKEGAGDIVISGEAVVGAGVPQGKVAADRSWGISSDGDIVVSLADANDDRVLAVCDDGQFGIGARAAGAVRVEGSGVAFGGGARAVEGASVSLGKDLIAYGSEGLATEGGVFLAANEGAGALDITAFASSTSPLYKTVWTKPLERYDLWVNGEQFNNAKLTIACGEGTAVFDPEVETPTLTLANATITGHPSDEAMSAGIFSKLGDLVIKTVGDNVIKPTDPGVDGVLAAGGCNVTVVGEGDESSSLELQDVNFGFNIGGEGVEGGESAGGVAGGNLVINGASVSIEGVACTGIWAYGDIQVDESAVSVKKTNASDRYYGMLSSSGDITFNESLVTMDTQGDCIHLGHGDEATHAFTTTGASGKTVLSSAEDTCVFVTPVADGGHAGEINGTIDVGGNLEMTSATAGTNVPDSAITLAKGWDYTEGTSLTQRGTVVIGEVITVTFDGNGHGGVLATLQVPKGKSYDDVVGAMSDEARADFMNKIACELPDGDKRYQVIDYCTTASCDLSMNSATRLYEDTTFFAKWLECITLVELAVEPPACGTATECAKNSQGYWDFSTQTNKPVGSAVGSNYIPAGDENGWTAAWVAGSTDSAIADPNAVEPYLGVFAGGLSYPFVGSVQAGNDYLFSKDVVAKVNGEECAVFMDTSGYISDRNYIGIVGEVRAAHVVTEEPTHAEVPATCSSAGVKAYWECSVCGRLSADAAGTSTIDAPQIIPATGKHSWDAGTVTKRPTTKAAGVRTFVCTTCGTKKTEAIPKMAPSGGGTELVLGKDGTALGAGSSAAMAERFLTTKAQGESEPAGTVFSLLQAKAKKLGKKSIKLAWAKARGAVKYVIYGAKCGKGTKRVKIATTTVPSITLSKVAGQKVVPKTFYKFNVVALDKNDRVVSTSKTIHVVTKGSKKYCNEKKVKVKKSVKTKAKRLKVGKNLKLKAKAVRAKKKLKLARHRAMAYESTNPKIATVTPKGVVSAKKKGVCYVYAYAQNGVYAKVKVVVK